MLETLEKFMLAEIAIADKGNYSTLLEWADNFYAGVGSEATPSIKVVEAWGGEGSSIGYTLEINYNGTIYYVKISGSYDSWEGTDYSYGTVSLVKPVEKTITVYERI